MSDRIDTVAGGLFDRYSVERELGRGGMATVYLARDLKHDRPVALKVLHPELAAGLAAERFLREIKIAANLQHPHIVPLHDSGEADGLLYYVMPFVEGESLRERLTREGPLPVDEALHIGREVADALGHAHRRDIVHRDIKPGNIMLSEGHALVTDFGIATAVTSAAGKTLTQTGIVTGTPTYMSPEQVEGDRELDGRSDIYSLGCVLYEMLAGQPPHVGETAMAILAQQALGEVASLTELRSDVPAGVERVVLKALANEAGERFAGVAEFAEALEGAPTAALEPTGAAPEPGKSIAVLPFRNMSADPETEYFCEGMAEEIINALAQVPSLEVAARTSSFAFQGQELEVREIGRRLDVSTVLEGSVRQAGKKLRITTQLIKVADGFHLWSERFDREMEDVFAIQDEIAGAIVDRFKVELGGREDEPLVERGTDDLDAYHLYLKGRHFWNQRNMQKAIECFEGAISKDPDYARPYAGIADAYCALGHYGFCPSLHAYQKAKEAAERAVALDDELAEGHFSLALTETYFGWDLQAAEREFRRAISLNPGLALARVFFAAILIGPAGRQQEGVSEAERAQELEPLSPLINAVAGVAFLHARDYERAVLACERALEIVPDWGPAQWVLSLPLTELGKHDDAIALLQSAVQSMQGSPFVLMMLGAAYARAGRADEAAGVLDQLRERSGREYIPPLSFAYVQAALGDMDEAFQSLEQAFEQRNFHAWGFGSWPSTLHVSSDPRWHALLEKAGLEQLVRKDT